MVVEPGRPVVPGPEVGCDACVLGAEVGPTVDGALEVTTVGGVPPVGCAVDATERKLKPHKNNSLNEKKPNYTGHADTKM